MAMLLFTLSKCNNKLTLTLLCCILHLWDGMQECNLKSLTNYLSYEIHNSIYLSCRGCFIYRM